MVILILIVTVPREPWPCNRAAETALPPGLVLRTLAFPRNNDNYNDDR